MREDRRRKFGLTNLLKIAAAVGILAGCGGAVYSLVSDGEAVKASYWVAHGFGGALLGSLVGYMGAVVFHITSTFKKLDVDAAHTDAPPLFTFGAGVLGAIAGAALGLSACHQMMLPVQELQAAALTISDATKA